MFHRDRHELCGGILGCHCCIFPLVDAPGAARAAGLDGGAAITSGRPADPRPPRHVRVGGRCAAHSMRWLRRIRPPPDTVEALRTDLRGRVFHRFSDRPVVAQAVARAVGATVLGGGGARSTFGVWTCTRTLLDIVGCAAGPRRSVSSQSLAGKRFTAPGASRSAATANADALRARRIRFAM
jgi:hypothetical protein